jgi:TldD protein
VATTAVALAKASAASRQVRRVELGTIPVVSNGTWSTPVRLDPFEVAVPQVRDWAEGIRGYITDLARQRGYEARFAQQFVVGCSCDQQERVFASTEGSYLTQTVTVMRPYVGFLYRDEGVLLPFRPAQTGYEYVTDTPWRELIRQEMERVDKNWGKFKLPFKPLQIGRYDVVFGAEAMADLVSQTLGTAAQVDRALGYEANAGGTSYLGPDPLTLLGTPVASPLVTVTADRSTSKALATIGWDDEGVVPEAFPLVQEGVLVDYETTREQAAWLAPWYGKQGQPVRSHGCAGSTDALTLPMQHTPNLTLAPGKEAVGLEELVASLDHGVVVESFNGGGYPNLNMDFQVLTGFGGPNRVTEVRQGKRVAQLGGDGGVEFRSPELWKHVKALGGAQSVERLYEFTSKKGEPEQQARYSVSAVPALITDVAFTNVARKV